MSQKTLDSSKQPPHAQFKKVKRKNTCLNCRGNLPNNHWSFCSHFCKDMFCNKKVKYLTDDLINNNMRLGEIVGSEFDNLPKVKDGDELIITKTEVGTTQKNNYKYVIITDKVKGEIFCTNGAIITFLHRDDVQEQLSKGETIETSVQLQTFDKTGRQGLGLTL